jgi:hypothetical protein
VILTEEILLLQKRAGIITEAEYKEKMAEVETEKNPEADENAKEGLQKALDALKSVKVEPSPKDKQLNEFEPVSMTVGLLASAPGLIRGLGSAVNLLSSPFLKDGQKGTIVGNAIKHFGHDLEEAYLRTIADLLKVAFPQTFGEIEYTPDNELGKTAKKLYMGILVAAGIQAGLSAANAHDLIVKGIEGGMAALKGSEAAELGAALAKAA